MTVLFVLFLDSQDRFRCQYAVDGGGHDASGVACALSGGIESPNGRLAGFVPKNPDGRRASGFRSGQYRVGRGKTDQLFVKFWKRQLHGARQLFGKHIVEVTPRDVRTVGGTDAACACAGAMLQKVPDFLRRGTVAAA